MERRGTEIGSSIHLVALSVDKAGHLMVCDLWNHRVQVFGGKFIGKNGAKGSGIGEFVRPVTAAVRFA